MAEGDATRVRDTRAGVTDLPVRLASAIVMLVLAGGALWLGTWFWTGFVVLLACGVIWEWNRLIERFGMSGAGETLWFFAGVLYVGGAAIAMVVVRAGLTDFIPDTPYIGNPPLVVLLRYMLPVIAVDVGAYFAGRAFGGPKIAPRISPAKTWSGFFGGALTAALLGIALHLLDYGTADFVIGAAMALVSGLLIAFIAQAGDFFESWMKRRAGVKDSGALIPGHGGLFDRLDGFIAVFFVLFLMEQARIVLLMFAA
ncbi:phosphatidate cytidylyltransferase [Porphyrobacter sp. AAP82]|uniref:phosphatidate cytidylyltransferase n=1 Tax=Porphyrobacter sp. AAP82 TaxID=1248917 RepID=UPI00030ED689|nr:phosphatidate cytidylyltransferase [Porphyrobacter sp. AAP82]